MKSAILGLSAFYHDSAAAILVDGHIVAAAQEERFTRKKHDPSFPVNAARFVLREAGFSIPFPQQEVRIHPAALPPLDPGGR